VRSLYLVLLKLQRFVLGLVQESVLLVFLLLLLHSFELDVELSQVARYLSLLPL
jgi:hypothetical protein